MKTKYTYHFNNENITIEVDEADYNILISLEREEKNLNRKESLRHLNNEGNGGYPKQKVVKKNGVSIEHYYPNDHGNPAHLHVKGGGGKHKNWSTSKACERAIPIISETSRCCKRKLRNY